VSDGRRELGRADRVLAGVWRLRLPLPWPGVPHVNAYAVRSGDGLVLVDTGIHEAGALEELQRALAQAGHRLTDIHLIVCTHAHSDHYGLAAPIIEATGCELWMHPNHEHMTRAVANPEQALERRIEVARQSGVPLEPLREWAERRRSDPPSIAGVALPDRDLLPGVEIETELGSWTVHETPGHAPSHVVLFQPEHRLLLSGDHLLGRVSLYFDFGYTPDPIAEFTTSLARVEKLGARLCLSGHGRPFTDVQAHIEANRAEIRDRLDRTMAAATGEPRSAFEIVPEVFGRDLDPMMATWMLTLILCFLTHLEHEGKIERLAPESEEEPERWVASQGQRETP
jgi:glyoxylase-like metal-dependent hydrolase (beta-lactamase superfamily II)